MTKYRVVKSLHYYRQGEILPEDDTCFTLKDRITIAEAVRLGFLEEIKEEETLEDVIQKAIEHTAHVDYVAQAVLAFVERKIDSLRAYPQTYHERLSFISKEELKRVLGL